MQDALRGTVMKFNTLQSFRFENSMLAVRLIFVYHLSEEVMQFEVCTDFFVD